MKTKLPLLAALAVLTISPVVLAQTAVNGAAAQPPSSSGSQPPSSSLSGPALALASKAPAASTTTTTTTTTAPAANSALPTVLGDTGAAGASPAAVQAASAQNGAAQSGTALPSQDGVNARSPGLSLDTTGANGGADAGADPFAEAAPPPVKTPEQVEAEIRARSYDAAITGLLPLRPGEIRKMLETYDKTQQAVEVPIYPYPKPQSVVQTVSLDPGSAPPEIKVATGHVTTLNILDVTGAAWPIQDISWAGNFEMVQPESGGNVIRITPMSEFAYGNISIRLINLTTPITFVVKAHRDSVQFRFDARIPEYGPNAKPPVVQGGVSVEAGNSIMSGILSGVAPDGAVRLDVAGVDGRTSAYKYNDMTYVRTPLTLLSPGWTSSVSSGDGMNVYQLHDSPVLLLSDAGDVKRARLTDRDEGGEDKATDLIAQGNKSQDKTP